MDNHTIRQILAGRGYYCKTSTDTKTFVTSGPRPLSIARIAQGKSDCWIKTTSAQQNNNQAKLLVLSPYVYRSNPIRFIDRFEAVLNKLSNLGFRLVVCTPNRLIDIDGIDFFIKATPELNSIVLGAEQQVRPLVAKHVDNIAQVKILDAYELLTILKILDPNRANAIHVDISSPDLEWELSQLRISGINNVLNLTREMSNLEKDLLLRHAHLFQEINILREINNKDIQLLINNCNRLTGLTIKTPKVDYSFDFKNCRKLQDFTTNSVGKISLHNLPEEMGVLSLDPRVELQTELPKKIHKLSCSLEQEKLTNTTITTLVYSNKKGGTLDLSIFQGLSSIYLSGQPVQKLLVPSSCRLLSLEIEVREEIKLGHLNSLEHLSSFSKLSYVDQLPNSLKYLNTQGACYVSNSADLPQLVYYNCSVADDLFFRLLNISHSTLETLILVIDKSTTLDLSSVEKLSLFDLKAKCPVDAVVNITLPISLQKLELDSDSSDTKLQITNWHKLTRLERLRAKNLWQFPTVEMPPSISELHLRNVQIVPTQFAALQDLRSLELNTCVATIYEIPLMLAPQLRRIIVVNVRATLELSQLRNLQFVHLVANDLSVVGKLAPSVMTLCIDKYLLEITGVPQHLQKLSVMNSRRYVASGKNMDIKLESLRWCYLRAGGLTVRADLMPRLMTLYCNADSCVQSELPASIRLLILMRSSHQAVVRGSIAIPSKSLLQKLTIGAGVTPSLLKNTHLPPSLRKLNITSDVCLRVDLQSLPLLRVLNINLHHSSKLVISNARYNGLMIQTQSNPDLMNIRGLVPALLQAPPSVHGLCLQLKDNQYYFHNPQEVECFLRKHQGEVSTASPMQRAIDASTKISASSLIYGRLTVFKNCGGNLQSISASSYRSVVYQKMYVSAQQICIEANTEALFLLDQQDADLFDVQVSKTSVPKEAMYGLLAIPADGDFHPLPNLPEYQRYRLKPNAELQFYWDSQAQNIKVKQATSSLIPIYAEYHLLPQFYSGTEHDIYVDDNIKYAISWLFMTYLQPGTYVIKGSVFDELYAQYAVNNKIELQHLIRYAKSFTNDNLVEDEGLKNALKNEDGFAYDLLRLILQAKGACRHRCYVFFALANTLGFKTRLVENDTHMRVEFFNAVQDCWQMIDLGGFGEEYSIENTLLEQEQASTQEEKTDEVDVRAGQQDKYSNVMQQWFDREKTIFANPKELFAKITRHHLLQVNDEAHARELIAIFSQLASAQRMPWIYLASDEDVKSALRTMQLTAAGPQETDGCMPQWIAQEQRFMVICDLRYFSTGDIATHKCMLEREPKMFDGKLIPANVTWINLSSVGQFFPDDVLSRAPKFAELAGLGPAMQVEEEKYNDESSIETSISVYDDNWRDALCSQIVLDKMHLSVQTGAFDLDGSRKVNLTIVVNIIDPAIRRQCLQFIYNVQHGHGFYVGGVYQTLNPALTINLSEHHTNDLVMQAEPAPHQAKLILVTLDNFDNLVQPLYVDNNNIVHQVDSPLIKSDDNPFEGILLLGDLTPSQLTRLTQWQRERSVLPIYRRQMQPENINKNVQIHYTTDVDGCVQKLLASQGITKESCFALDYKTDITDIFDSQSQVSLQGTKVTAAYQVQEPLMQLQAGKKIVLFGTPNNSLMLGLATLMLANSYVWLNGKVKFRDFNEVVIVTAAPVDFRLIDFPRASSFSIRTPDLIKQAFTEEEQIDPQLLNLMKFVTNAKEIIAKYFQDEVEYHLSVRRVLTAWAMIKHRNHSTPLASLLLQGYTTESDIFNWLNVVLKIMFAPDEHESGLDPEYAHANNSDMQLLNSLNAKALREILQDESSMLKSLNKATKFSVGRLTLDAAIKAVIVRAHNAYKNTTHQESMLRQIKVERVCNFIRSFGKCYLFGPPGSGKTTLANHIHEYLGCAVEYYYGIERVQAWNTDDKPGLLKILIIDEADMLHPGAYDQFTLILNQFDTAKQAIICISNPKSYSTDRYAHPFLLDMPMVRIEQFSDKELADMVILPFLNKPEMMPQLHLPTIVSDIIKYYRAAQQEFGIKRIGLRQLKTLLCVWSFYRFTSALANRKLSVLKARLKFICLQLFQPMSDIEPHISFTVHNEDIQRHFAEQGFVLTESRKNFLAYIDLVFSTYKAMNVREPGLALANMVRGVLVQGESGIGKSALLAEYLRYKNVNYVQISVSQDNDVVEQQLRRAKDNNCVVILDELNLNPRLENMLGKLMAEKSNPDFFIFVTQNDTRYATRHSLPLPLLNRLVCMQLKPLTELELKGYIRGLLYAIPCLSIERVGAIVEAYQQACRSNASMNQRVLTHVLQSVNRQYEKFLSDITNEAGADDLLINDGLFLDQWLEHDSSRSNIIHVFNTLSNINEDDFPGCDISYLLERIRATLPAPASLKKPRLQHSGNLLR